MALARRTTDFLSGKHPSPTPAGLLPRPAPFTGDGPGWTVLFDNTLPSFQRWRRVGGNQGGSNQPPCGFHYIDGQIVTIGTGDHALLYFPQQRFADFILKLQLRIFAINSHNSGVFVRLQNPLLDLQGVLQQRADADGRPWRTNRAWTAVYSGFEVQIDDTAKPNPPGRTRNRTGAIYDIPAGDPGDATLQAYQPGPALTPNDWFEYEIRVQGLQYEAFSAELMVRPRCARRSSGIWTHCAVCRQPAVRTVATSASKLISMVVWLFAASRFSLCKRDKKTCATPGKVVGGRLLCSRPSACGVRPQYCNPVD